MRKVLRPRDKSEPMARSPCGSNPGEPRYESTVNDGTSGVATSGSVAVDPVRAAYEAQNYIQAIEQLTMTTLRNIIGGLDLEQTLTSREEINQKLRAVLERRRDALGPEGGIEWGHAEALAYATLLEEGVAIRLTGQDSERGTFAHRHAVLHDADTGEEYTPLEHIPDARAGFEVRNAPLTETAALGFEYGYSTTRPDALVLWEAQFGDFVNVAQVIVDQFIMSGRTKWGDESRLTLLLPHAYEGSGPEHSSARLERFLKGAAEDNCTIVYPTTAAQCFHMLRRQALAPERRPLIVMTPKSLLRLKDAASNIDDLTHGTFIKIIDDAGVGVWESDGTGSGPWGVERS